MVGGGEFAGLRVDNIMPPHVTPLGHRHLTAGTAEHQALLHARRLGEGFVYGLFQWQNLAASIQPIGSDHQFRGRVIVSIGDRLGTEASEDDRVNRTEPCTGEHRDGQLRSHRHVDADDVTLAYAELRERLGALSHFDLEIAVRKLPLIAGFALPDDREFVTATGLDVGIYTVVARVGFTTDKPLRMRRLPLANVTKRLEPMQVLQRLFPPKIIPRIPRRGDHVFVLLHT